MPNGDFEPMYSTNNIWYDTYTAQCLTNHLEDMGADIDTLQTGKANVNHTHNEYSPINHEHSEYAPISHSHTGYATDVHTHSYNDLTDVPTLSGSVQSDWLQNDSAQLDYVKNRPFYSGENSSHVIVSEQEIEGFQPDTSCNASYATNVVSFVLEVGKTYTVKWDGVDYVLIAKDAFGDVCLGNARLYYTYDGEITNEPFAIVYENGGEYGSDFYYLCASGTSVLSHTVGITTLEPEVVKIDKKYLPDIIGSFGTGKNSVILNGTNEATDTLAFAHGRHTKAYGDSSHAEGYSTTVEGYGSHVEGFNTRVPEQDVDVGVKYSGISAGQYAHAEGMSTVAVGPVSHAEGACTKSKGKHSHAEGLLTLASGDESHAEGEETVASSRASHAEGYKTMANGGWSHTEGKETRTDGHFSHAEGYGTKAAYRSQHVDGEYNIVDNKLTANNTIRGNYVRIVGNGTSDTVRSNAYTLDWDGNAWYSGTVEGTALIVKSSTPNSTKRFKITVDDSGAISTTEIN